MTWRPTLNSYKPQTKKEETSFLADYQNHPSRRITRPAEGHRQRLRRSGTRPGTRRGHPGRGITRPPCSLPVTSTGTGRQDHADDDRQQGQEQRSQPGQGRGPRAKRRTTRATTTTRTTRSPAAGSRPGSCRRITRQTAGPPAPGGTTRAANHPARPALCRWTSTTRATTTTGSPAAIRTDGSRQEHADDGRQQGQEQRNEPDQGTVPRAKKRAARAKTATTATTTTRSPAAESRPRSCRRITRQYRQRLRRSGSRTGARWNHPAPPCSLTATSTTKAPTTAPTDTTTPAAAGRSTPTTAGSRARDRAANRARAQGHGQRREHQDRHSGHDHHGDHGNQEPGHRIEARPVLLLTRQAAGPAPGEHPQRLRRSREAR